LTRLAREALMRAREGLRRPARPDLEVALKAAVGAGLAMWLSELAGLADPYWAAISAVLAAAPTLGANLTAALSRVVATVVGLALGLAAVALWGSGVLVAGVTVFIALLVLPALSLDRGARLGAATTVIMTALPSAEALDDALARGLNILLGCGVAVAVGFVLLPKRAGDRLRDALRADVAATGELARSALETYLGRRPSGDPATGVRRCRAHARPVRPHCATPLTNLGSAENVGARSSGGSLPPASSSTRSQRLPRWPRKAAMIASPSWFARSSLRSGTRWRRRPPGTPTRLRSAGAWSKRTEHWPRFSRASPLFAPAGPRSRTRPTRS
jgi:uncharacterized membrane protein YccC